MSDFELQRALRGLRHDEAPARDLWPAIAARVGVAASAPAPRRQRGPRPLWLAGAAVLLAAAASLWLHPWDAPASRTLAGDAVAPLHAPRTQPPNGDPRFLAGAIVLDTAHAQLEHALAQQPDSALLGELLKRTQARRARLGHDAGRAG